MTHIQVLESAIKKSKPFVSSVIFLGGEPLMQSQVVVHLAGFAKKSGLLVGVHTNGFYPLALDELIKEKLLDKAFIDIKAPLGDSDAYGRVIGCDTFPHVRADPADAVRRIKDSVLLALESNVELELRTTVFRGFMGDMDDVREIAASILSLTGDRNVPYVLQQGLAENAPLASMRGIRPFSRDEMLGLASSAHESLDNVWIRTKERGNEKVNFEPV
jgi:pyruvate formate lyase activating enzyme